MAIFSMLSVCSPPPYLLNTKNMPIWAHFQCLACIYHPSTIFPPPEHQKHAHMGMFSMFSVSLQHSHPLNIKKCPDGCDFCKGDCRVNTICNELVGNPKRFSHYAVMLNTCIPSRGSKEERIRIPLLAWPNIDSK